MDDLVPAKASSTPLYLQIAKNLKGHISSGQFEKGEALPSERDLCNLTGASRVTVRKAIGELIAEGLLFRRQGSGTFVSDRIEAPNSYLSGFSDDAKARGEAPSALWILRAFAAPTQEEAAILEIGTDEDVARLGRLRLCNGEPLAIEHAVIPKTFLPDLDAVTSSLYDALEAEGHRPVKGRQKIRASLATPTEAGLLSVGEGSEILRIERVARDVHGTTIELTRSAYRGDRYDFVSNLN